MSTYQLGGREYPITGYIDTGGRSVPLVELPMGSDYEWQLMALKDRIRHPRRYAKIDESVVCTIIQLSIWLIRHQRMRRN